MPHPDPIVSANLYCSGQADRALRHAVLPFRQALRTSGVEASLWWMRYSRGGEHLKLRVHAEAESHEAIWARLETTAEAFLAELGPLDPDAERPLNLALTPIDVEDETETPPADRSLLQTQYRRSPIVFGGPPFIDDDAYLALATDCLGQGCDWILAELENTDGFSASLRQLTYLQMMIAALAALGLSKDQRIDCLLYCRDWLVRFPLLKMKAKDEAADQWLARLEKRAALLSDFQTTLRGLAQDRWREGDDALAEAASPEGRWQRSLGTLADYLEPHRDEARYQVDPFASHFLFPPVSKLFSSVANPLGLSQAAQAQTLHLLLSAVAPERAGETIVLRRPAPAAAADGDPSAG